MRLLHAFLEYDAGSRSCSGDTELKELPAGGFVKTAQECAGQPWRVGQARLRA